MVKLTGPGLAAAASGTLADTVTFSNWKGRAYLKTKSTPKQPNTAPQRAMREIMRFLSSQWENIPGAHQDSWGAHAAVARITPINAYQQGNLARWRTFLRPSSIYPATETGSWGAANSHAATGKIRSIEFTWRVVTLGQLWGQQAHIVSGNGVLPTWADLVHIEPVYSTGIKTYTIPDIEPGTRWVCVTRFCWTGLHATFNKWYTTVVLP